MSWDTFKLSDCCVSITDGDHLPPPKADSGIPFVTISNINTINQFDFTNTMFVPQDYYDKLDSKRKAQIGDVLYSVVGSFGIPVYIKDNRQFVFQRHIAILRPNEKILPRFLYYTMLSRDFYAKADAVAVGAAQRTVGLSSLRNIKIDVPTIDEQNKIVNILSAYDDLIENNQKQIKLLEEAAQRLYKEWFVDIRFPGHENTPIIDGIPQGWVWKSILDNNIFKFVNSRVLPFDGEKTYYATADIAGTNVVSPGEKITFENKPSRAAIQPVPHSVWFARMSNSYKILNCFGENEWITQSAILSSGFAGFSSEKEYYGFVYETIASEYFDVEKNRYATGATQVSLTNEGLSKIKILLPNIDLVRRYSSIIEPIMYKSELLKNSNVKLKEARNRLLPKLISGEIEV